MEHKATTVEIKTAADGTFEGYAAVFGNVDSYGDIIQPGAFTKTIQERRSQIKILWNHDSFAPPVGKLLDIREDAYGLRVQGKLLDTPRGQEIAQGMRDGVIDSMSIGYTTIKHAYEQREDLGREVRLLQELKLYEFSPVNFPANEAATITAVKRKHEAEALLVQVADFFSQELKAGRTLSVASLERIQAALDSIQESANQLEQLIQAVEPDAKARTTPSPDEPPKHSPAVSALLETAQAASREQKSRELLAEFRAFGARLGGQHA